MSMNLRRLNLTGVLLLAFITVVAVTMWSLDLVAEQRTFAMLMSAELVAFALLVYLYYEENPKEISKRRLLSGSVSLVLLVLLSIAVFPGVIVTTPTPNVSISLYEGEISPTLYGFGYSQNNLTSPGPTLTFNVTNVVNMTVTNVGQLPHNWAIVNANQSSAPVVFNAQIASLGDPLQSGQTGSVIFTVTTAGSFYYICQVPGHQDVGMWGPVIVNP